MKVSWGFKPLAMAATVAATLSVAIGGDAAGAAHLVVQHVVAGSPAGPVVVAIGDSIMEGHGLLPDQAWPALLAKRYGWNLINLASDGSGFVTVGNDGDTFSDQAAAAVGLHPSIVLISSSSNDLGNDESSITTSTDATLSSLRVALPQAEIVVVSPVWSDTAVPAQLETIAQETALAASSIGAVTVDIGQPLGGRQRLMQDDDVHPTATGQKVLAHHIERLLPGTLSA